MQAYNLCMMPLPLFSELPKTANDLFTQEAKDFSGRIEYSTSLKNGVVSIILLSSSISFLTCEQVLKFEGVRSDEDGGLTTALIFKKTLSKVDITARLSSDKSSSLTLENSSVFPNLTLRLDRPLTPSATLTNIALPADKTAPASVDKKPSEPATAATAVVEAAHDPAPAPVLTAEYKAANYTASASLDVAKKEALLSGVLQHSGYATDLMDITRNECFRSLETQNAQFCVIDVRTSSHEGILSAPALLPCHRTVFVLHFHVSLQFRSLGLSSIS